MQIGAHKVLVLGVGNMGRSYALAYHNLDGDFFLSNNFIDLLYGSDALRNYLKQGKNINQIRATWQEDLDVFKSIRVKYLLY